MIRSRNSYQKRPQILPPLPNTQAFLRPMDPLQPPDLLFMESRLGSPAPKPTPRDPEYEINANNGKPGIKISNHEEIAQKEPTGRDLMRLDLLSDPLFTEANNAPFRVQKRNSLKPDTKWDDAENFFLNNISKNQLKNLRNDLDKKIKCSLMRPLDDQDNAKPKTCNETKVFQIPNRYTPLKPIGQTMKDSQD